MKLALKYGYNIKQTQRHFKQNNKLDNTSKEDYFLYNHGYLSLVLFCYFELLF